eukprot:TRINITY_DN1799_c0_g1_i2.p1 TRINITY_DN1799_c0_g1~~TRINITY_DN1799_c0_g1_i2.p1  ORF type:complete len:320 (+),score=48.47 TRINITY_DN1799_c0_g1_i2:285-1244(+)
MDSVGALIITVGVGCLVGGYLYARSRSQPANKTMEQSKNARVTVSEVWIYPIKSCGGISLPAEKLGPFSFVRDRRWMVVREDTKRFLTQRQMPKMSLITPTWDSQNDCAIYSAPGMTRKLTIPFKGIQPDGPRYDVGIWDDTCPAIDEGDDAASWFSEYLGLSVRLVRTPDDMQRKTGEKYRAPESDNVAGYADGFPFLLISEASLKELNNMIGETEYPIIMRRFRPNIVVKGTAPFEEDNWKAIQIGSVTLHNVKPCGRCKLTTVVPDKGEFGGPEPLQTIQKQLGGNFGQNLSHSTGSVGKSISVGQEVTILETKNL